MQFLFHWRFVCLSVLLVTAACTPPKKVTLEPVSQKQPEPVEIFALDSTPANSSLLSGLLQKLPGQFSAIIANPEKYRLQVIYTQIDRDEANKPVFHHHYFHVNDLYTYPASTVKFPAAVLALEKLNKLGIDGLGLNTPMFTESLRPGEKPVLEDPSSKSGKPSAGHYMKKILLVSDNDAHNRLYEFLGQQPFNERLHQLGFSRAQMTHRLSISLNDKDNRTTNPVWFMGTKGETLYRQPFAISNLQYAERDDKVGKAYMKSGAPGQPDIKVEEPLDFSMKNRWPLKYAHLLTQWIMFPESQPEGNRLVLSASDYTFLWKYMSMLPGESDYPKYPANEYWPAYVKFLLAGSEEGPWFNPNVRIFNKVGNAYGFLEDAAYIVDFDKKIEFMLSAVIYTNSDEVLNDDAYDYDTVGFPFLKALGQVIYQHELDRERKVVPDLSRYKMVYGE
jgi:Beta-lactamase enzyme family